MGGKGNNLTKGAEDGRGSNSNSKHGQGFHWPLPSSLANPFANPLSNPLALLADQLDDPRMQRGVTFVNWTAGGDFNLRKGAMEERSSSTEEKAGARRFSFFGVQLPDFPSVSIEPPNLLQTARISANPLVWAASNSNPMNQDSKSSSNTSSRSQLSQTDPPPSTSPQKASLPSPSKLPPKAEQSRGGAKSQLPEGGATVSPPVGGKAQPSEGGVGTASQLLGQTEAVLDSVKLAVAGISSNVMDNLPPLRKTAYPDRRKLSSVQEFYRYTEAEGRRLFEELDADRDGNVTLEDLEAAMRRRRLPQEYARKFLHKVRRGLFAKSFTWEEFSALMDEREPAILRAYNSLDLNSAGTLQRSQIKASLQRNGLPTTDRNINAMMRFLTGEADGQIAYGQFRNFLLLLPPERLRDHPSTVWFEAATVVPLYAPAVATGSVLKSALAGGLACAIPTFFLHPVDTMKTRVQASTMSLRDLVQQLPEIGARGLYRGAVPAIAGQFAGQGLRTGMLEASKAVLKNVAPDIPEMQVQSLASFTSTFMGTALRIPCEVIKQRCQAGLYDNWQAAAIGTYRSDGLPGFFRGTTATLLREVPFYVAGMMIYEQIKKGVRKGIRRELKPWETIAVGGFSGGLAAVTTTPFDVIKTRMMTAQPGVASSMGATFVHILKNEGVMALYKGALPRFFWIAPLGAMNFAGYELAKRAMEDQDRKQAREAEATAEAELRALEEAEANQRRSVFPQFSKLPDLREKLPRLRTVLSDLRTRVSKPRTSGQRSTVAGSVKGLVERIGGRNKRETETETVTDIETAGTGRITGRVGGSHEKGYVGGLEKEGSTQTLGKVELEEVRGETGLKGLVARIDKQRKGLNSVGGFTWPGKSKEGEGSEKGVTKESVNTVSGHKGEVPSKEGSGQPVKNASEEGVSERVGESVAATLRKSETEPAQREGEAPLAGSVGGASGRFGAAAGETGPASVPVEQRDRRGFLAGVPVPGIFKRPRKVGSNGNDRSAGTGSSRANLVTTDVQSANDAELEKDGSVSEGLIAAVQKKDDMEKK